jgi:hypothetical protein
MSLFKKSNFPYPLYRLAIEMVIERSNDRVSPSASDVNVNALAY